MRTKYNILLILVLLVNSIASAQVITTYAGTGLAGYSGDGGLAIKAQLNIPYGTAFDKTGNLYIVDNPNNRIRKVDAVTHIITTAVGLGSNGGNCPLKDAGLQNPRGIAFDKKGNMYITDASTCVRKVDFTAQTITTVAGIRGQPSMYSNVVGDGGPALNATFDGALGIAVDDTGNIFVADYLNFKVRRIDAATGIITTYAATAFPFGLAFDSRGSLYFSESHGVYKVDPATNIISMVAGNVYNNGYNGDGGLATDALLSGPAGIAFDKYDNLYIADEINNRIRKIDNKSGIISTIAGTGIPGYSGDCGPAVKALLYWPVAITVDAAGQVYFAEQTNNVVRKISAAADSLVTGAQTVCLNDAVTLSALEAGGNWSSSDPTIADVNNNGLVNGLSPGKAVITYTINQGYCQVITSNHSITVDAVNEDAAIVTSADLCTGSVARLKEPGGGYWYSSDPAIVKTDSFGNIEGMAPGNAVLKYLVNTTCSITDKATIRVFQPQTLFIGKDTSICKNQPLKLDAGNDFIKYQWNTGDTTRSIMVSKVGIYSVKATDAHTCISGDTVAITQVLQPPVFTWPADSAFCEGSKLVLYAPLNTSDLLWQNGTSASSYTVTEAGKYSLVATGTNGCTDTATIQISKTTLPVFTLGADTSLCKGQTLELKPALNTSAQYVWQDGSRQQSFMVKEPGIYSLKAFNQCGAAADSLIVANGVCNFIIPSAFTPNGDGLNDVFKMKYAFPATGFHMIIYNRWGEKVFETTEMNKGWDGSYKGYAASVNTYIWIISFIDYNNKAQKYQGTVTLIR